MANHEFYVSDEYAGYTFVGCSAGSFIPRGSKEPRDYANMYVISPVSDFTSEDYAGSGFKAEKKKCLSADVWKNLQIGDRVKLFFDDKERVVMAVQDN